MKFLSGNGFIILLIVEYALIAGVYAFEYNWAKVLYFVGAIILSLGVLWME